MDKSLLSNLLVGSNISKLAFKLDEPFDSIFINDIIPSDRGKEPEALNLFKNLVCCY